MEPPAQDSASDSCSEKRCVRQHNCPPCHPACSPSCPIGYLSIPQLTSFTLTSHVRPQVKRHNLSLKDINKKGRESEGEEIRYLSSIQRFPASEDRKTAYQRSFISPLTKESFAENCTAEHGCSGRQGGAGNQSLMDPADLGQGLLSCPSPSPSECT